MQPPTIYAPERLDTEDPTRVVTVCIENGAGSLLLDEGAIPDELFDLSNGVLGALVHKLGLYHIPVALVAPDPSRYSTAFQDFVREANRGTAIRFTTSREEAVRWLTEA